LKNANQQYFDTVKEGPEVIYLSFLRRFISAGYTWPMSRCRASNPFLFCRPEFDREWMEEFDGTRG
jgi:hypothetical protein